MIKTALLPLYIKLYDDTVPELRPRLEKFYAKIADILKSRGFEVMTCPFCRTSDEFTKNISEFEKGGAQVLVTLHMAYSPSLESSDALAKTSLPIVIFDTTETEDWSKAFSADIDYNHGIHGVMDMCNLLKRNKKEFSIAAGHIDSSDIISRVDGFIRASVAATSLKGSRTAVFGGVFDGMGDFRVTAETMKNRFGADVVDVQYSDISKYISEVPDALIDAETEIDKNSFDFSENIDINLLRITEKNGLGLRRYLEQNRFDAFSVNFMKVSDKDGVGFDTMPFLEACKAMKRGIGYAGEGDSLTSAFVGAFMKGFEKTSFIEIFCPDWKNGNIFISHTGEANYAVTTRPTLYELNFPYGARYNPIYGSARYVGGKGVFVNISPDGEDFTLTVSEVEMLDVDNGNFPRDIRGTFRPHMSTGQFLENICRTGATHHSIFVYGATAETMCCFARLLNMKTVVF